MLVTGSPSLIFRREGRLSGAPYSAPIKDMFRSHSYETLYNRKLTFYERKLIVSAQNFAAHQTTIKRLIRWGCVITKEIKAILRLAFVVKAPLF